MAFFKETSKRVSQDLERHIQRRARRKRLEDLFAKHRRFQAKSWTQSVGFAVEGMLYAIRTQRNFRIDAVIMALVVIAAIYFQITRLEWLLIILTIGGVLILEIMNTAVELIVDMWTQGEYDRNAKRIKDMSAAACLMMAGFAAIIGMVIFIPYLANHWPFTSRL